MKKVVSILLCLIMLVGIMPTAAFAAELSNMKVDSNGVLSWDAYPDATEYGVYVDKNDSHSFFSINAPETSMKLKDEMDRLKSESAIYTVKVIASKEPGNRQLATKTILYDYVSPFPQLAKAANLRWEGMTAKWSAVENAEEYDVILYESNYKGEIKKRLESHTVKGTEFDFSDTPFFSYYYVFTVVAANKNGYVASKKAISPAIKNTNEKPVFQVTVDENGILHWNKHESADGYGFYYLTKNFDYSITAYCKIEDPNATSFDLKAEMDEQKVNTGIYEIKFSAEADGNILETKKLKYKYTSPFERLAKAQNLRWDGSIARWDAVENSKMYNVALYQCDKDGSERSKKIIVFRHCGEGKTEFDFTDYMEEGRYYLFCVSAENKKVYIEGPTAESAPMRYVPKVLKGNVYITSGVMVNRPISLGFGMDSETSNIKSAEPKQFRWQFSKDDGNTWTDIYGDRGAVRNYVPNKADLNRLIRVKITVPGYVGEIVSSALEVHRTTNTATPEAPILKAVQTEGGTEFTTIEITNRENYEGKDVELCWSKTDKPDWNNKITSDTVHDDSWNEGERIYVFAKYRDNEDEDFTFYVGGSVNLSEKIYLQRLALTDGVNTYKSGSKIYIKKDDGAKTLKIIAEPENANTWSTFKFGDFASMQDIVDIGGDNEFVYSNGAEGFPKDKQITLTPKKAGHFSLNAIYTTYKPESYGTWEIYVYDESSIDDVVTLENVPHYENLVLNVGDSAELPTELPNMLPEGNHCRLEWRIVRTSMTGAEHITENENIELKDGKIIAKKAHEEGKYSNLELIAIKPNGDKRFFSGTGFSVTVKDVKAIPVENILVNPTELMLAPGEKASLTASVLPSNATGVDSTKFEWESSNTAVAVVDGNGAVRAVSDGSVVITVRYAGKSASCNVTVSTHKHIYSDWSYNGVSHWYECIDPNCPSINESIRDVSEHSFKWIIDKEATKKETGLKHEECVVCGCVRNPNTIINRLPQSNTDVIHIFANAASKGEKNPNTGAPEMSTAVLVLAAAVLVLKKRG